MYGARSVVGVDGRSPGDLVVREDLAVVEIGPISVVGQDFGRFAQGRQLSFLCSAEVDLVETVLERVGLFVRIPA